MQFLNSSKSSPNELLVSAVLNNGISSSLDTLILYFLNISSNSEIYKVFELSKSNESKVFLIASY